MMGFDQDSGTSVQSQSNTTYFKTKYAIMELCREFGKARGVPDKQHKSCKSVASK